jgi:hypothetical protein
MDERSVYLTPNCHVKQFDDKAEGPFYAPRRLGKAWPRIVHCNGSGDASSPSRVLRINNLSKPMADVTTGFLEWTGCYRDGSRL